MVAAARCCCCCDIFGFIAVTEELVEFSFDVTAEAAASAVDVVFVGGGGGVVDTAGVETIFRCITYLWIELWISSALMRFIVAIVDAAEADIG